MASTPQENLPLFYRDLMPLDSREHVAWRCRQVDSVEWAAGHHAIPLTSEEFSRAQHSFPIVFSPGANPTPLALMGLNDGVNAFIDANGKPIGEFYLPAYIRRYPYLSAKLTEDAEELTLCFDPQSGLIGNFDDGEALFDESGKPATAARSALEFCEGFEKARLRTQTMMQTLTEYDLLKDGEVVLSSKDDAANPYVYRGFRIVDEEKLRKLDGDRLSALSESGLLPLLYAHLFSLDMMRVVFARQTDQGTLPPPDKGGMENGKANGRAN